MAHLKLAIRLPAYQSASSAPFSACVVYGDCRY